MDNPQNQPEPPAAANPNLSDISAGNPVSAPIDTTIESKPLTQSDIFPSSEPPASAQSADIPNASQPVTPSTDNSSEPPAINPPADQPMPASTNSSSQFAGEPPAPPPPPKISSKGSNNKRIALIAMFLIFMSAIFALTLVFRSTKFTTQNEATTPSTCTLYNTNIVLVIDRSSSMTAKESDGRTKLEWAKQSAKTLVTRIASMTGNTAKISVVSFGSQGNDGTGVLSADYNSTVHITLSSDFNAVQTAIDGVKYIKSGTCIECGIRLANQQLTSPALNRVVILLSDGKANHNWLGQTANSTGAINYANTGRSSGLVYYVLGYGTGTNIDETTLKAIAGKAENYKYKPDATTWPEAFLSIVDLICALPTATPTKVPTPTATKTPTPSPTKIPTPTFTSTPSPTKTPTPTPTKTPTPLPTKTPTPLPTKTPTPLPTKTPTPTLTLTPTPTKLPTPTPTKTPTPSPTKTPTPSPTKTPTPTLTSTPSLSPTKTPTPTMCIVPKAVTNVKVSCPFCK